MPTAFKYLTLEQRKQRKQWQQNRTVSASIEPSTEPTTVYPWDEFANKLGKERTANIAMSIRLHEQVKWVTRNWPGARSQRRFILKAVQNEVARIFAELGIDSEVGGGPEENRWRTK